LVDQIICLNVSHHANTTPVWPEIVMDTMIKSIHCIVFVYYLCSKMDIGFRSEGNNIFFLVSLFSVLSFFFFFLSFLGGFGYVSMHNLKNFMKS